MKSTSKSDPGPRAVLRFWFEETGPAQWFKKDQRFDDLVREKFAETVLRARAAELCVWREDVNPPQEAPRT